MSTPDADLHTRVTVLESHAGHVDRQLDRIETQQGKLDHDISKLGDRLDARIDALQSDIKATHERINGILRLGISTLITALTTMAAVLIPSLIRMLA